MKINARANSFILALILDDLVVKILTSVARIVGQFIIDAFDARPIP